MQPCMLNALHIGARDYNQVLNLQKFLHCYATSASAMTHHQSSLTQAVDRILSRRLCGSKNFIITCSHKPAVYTMGRRNCMTDLLLSSDEEKEYHVNQSVLTRKNGIDVVKTNRGGGVTYHGPGQLVVYFIIDARKMHSMRASTFLSWKSPVRYFIWQAEEAMVKTLHCFGATNARRREGESGIWAKHGKIGFIGVEFSKWVSMHGISLNVSKSGELPLRDVIMCENEHDQPTSIETETGNEIAGDLTSTFVRNFADIVGFELTEHSID